MAKSSEPPLPTLPAASPSHPSATELRVALDIVKRLRDVQAADMGSMAGSVDELSQLAKAVDGWRRDFAVSRRRMLRMKRRQVDRSLRQATTLRAQRREDERKSAADAFSRVELAARLLAGEGDAHDGPADGDVTQVSVDESLSKHDVDKQPRPNVTEDSTAGANGHYARPRKCYVCKTRFTALHHFYPDMCSACGDANLSMRSLTADLRGRAALVTGGRIKIGRVICLSLLRCGAEVHVTTRFPGDALLRFAAEPDFSAWKDRLVLHGLDLRDLPSVARFADELRMRLPRLDILIHNAALTIYRPPSFYLPLLEVEAAVHSAALSNATLSLDNGCVLNPAEFFPSLPPNRDVPWAIEANGDHALDIVRVPLSAAASQAQLMVGVTAGVRNGALEGTRNASSGLAANVSSAVAFPSRAFADDGQQLDMRPNNSWTQRIGDISAGEAFETALVNQHAPFMLTNALLPLLEKTASQGAGDGPVVAAQGRRCAWIVCVSSMEGVFERENKTDAHPHTNMAKAALNMLVRTSGPTLAKKGVFMTAVDTGWVTDELPVPHAARVREASGFEPPLDATDGAMRVLHPVYAGINDGWLPSGVFLKDYAVRPHW